MGQNLFAQRQQRAGVVQRSLQAIGEESEAWAHVTHNFGMREEDFLDGC